MSLSVLIRPLGGHHSSQVLPSESVLPHLLKKKKKGETMLSRILSTMTTLLFLSKGVLTLMIVFIHIRRSKPKTIFPGLYSVCASFDGE